MLKNKKVLPKQDFYRMVYFAILKCCNSQTTTKMNQAIVKNSPSQLYFTFYCIIRLCKVNQIQ